MHVHAASNATDLWKLQQSSQAASVNSVSSTSGTNGSSSAPSTSGDGSSLSSTAQLYSTLHTISQSNPAEFQKITAQLATQLQQAASTATDPAQKTALNQLAANFQSASKSGNFSDLFSQTGSPADSSLHTGGHNHHYYAGTDSSTTTASGTSSNSDSLSAVFSKALTQIASDLQPSASSTAVKL